ncbi:MAG: hypothetical protein IJ314_00425 [Bacteroidales bacterium]|nr:hypothetical protein [Bacteroidales bacterium]
MKGLIRISAACLLAVLVSCSGQENRRALKSVEDAISSRYVRFEAYEALLESYKDSLAAAGSNDERWRWTDRLYESYRHYDLDSAYFYSLEQKKCCSTRYQQVKTRLSESKILALRGYGTLAEEMFLSVDTSGLDQQSRMTYLKGAISLYSDLLKFSGIPDARLSERLRCHQEDYLLLDSTSFYARRTYAQYLRDMGNTDEAMAIFKDAADNETDLRNLTSSYYNIAMLYGYDDLEQCKLWLTRSIVYDFEAPNRDYMALYQLALILYEEGDYERASAYIQTNINDVVAGHFPMRIVNSSKAQTVIAEAKAHKDKVEVIILVLTICLFAILTLIVSFSLLYSYRQSRRLKATKNMLLSLNDQLKKANAVQKATNLELKNANAIKDNYVFRYMDLSIRYLDRVEEVRHEIRTIVKTGNIDELKRALRSPSAMYDEYKKFYQIFDDTFLGIFPDFVSKVNGLLKEECRFQDPTSKTLTTELRILAAIRLGIGGSHEIASFLKCSLHTVYTYRNRLKNAASCPRNEFEDLIKRL